MAKVANDRRTFSANDVDSAFAVDGRNVRVLVLDDKRKTYPASVTKFAKGYTARVERKAVAKELSVAEATAFIREQVAKFPTADLETNGGGTVEQVTTNEVTVLTRDEAALRLGISKDALRKRIARALKKGEAFTVEGVAVA